MPTYDSYKGYRITESNGLWRGKRIHLSPAITSPTLIALKAQIDRAVAEANKPRDAQVADRKRV